MGKRKGNVPKRQQEVPNKKSRKAPIVLVVVSAAILAVVLSLLLYKKDTAPTDQKKDASGGLTQSRASKPAPADHFRKLKGRWRRPDGGYIIDIRSADAQGDLQAAYFNPRSIHVSQARAARKEGKIHIFIELTDTGYPGATYSLIFDPQRDVLAGLYYQPTAGRNFDVLFARVPPQ